MVRRKTKQEFINKSNKIYNNYYNYDKVIYKNRDTEVIIICPIHGEFNITPKNHHRNIECDICKDDKKQKERAKDFIENSNKIHNNFYIYDKIKKIKNLGDKVEIYCPIHKKYFTKSAENHQRGIGCTYCRYDKMALNQSDTLESFIEKANKKHNNKYNYEKVNYIKSNIKVKIICPINNHIKFFQNPNDHLNGQGCPICGNNGFSNMQIEWLRLRIIIDDTKIQHKLNKGEYLIDIKLNKKKKERLKSVDGYSSKLNKVYEFHGDYWHGNPKRFNLEDINKCVKKTFGELYKNTKLRIEKIKELNYIVEEMWEYDWLLYKKLLKDIRNFDKNNLIKIKKK